MALDTDLLLEAEDIAHLVSPLTLRKKVREAQGKPFRVRPHQKIIADAARTAILGQGKRFVAVSIAQQQGKSDITSIACPQYVMELHTLGLLPGGLCGLMSYEDSLAQSWSTTSRREMLASPEVFFSAPRKDSRAAGFWETEAGGGILAVGTSGSIQGRSITFLGIDDPTKNLVQAASRAHQDTIWDLWCSVLFGRLQPWSSVLVTMARMAPDDFIGRLKSRDYEGDPDDWEFIEIAYECEDEESDPLGRKLGQPLQRPQADQSLEEAYAEMAAIKKTTSPFIYRSMYQQDPRDPEGTILPESKARYWGGDIPKEERIELPAEFDQMLMSWDMAFKDLKTSDWVVGGLWGQVGANFFLIDRVRGRWSFTETCTRVANFAEAHRARYSKPIGIVVEDKANGTAVIDQLRSRVGALMEFDPSDYGSKLARAHSIQPFWLGGNIFVPAPSERSWVREYLRELSDFRGTGNETDDQVDMTTQAVLHMQKYHYEPAAIANPIDLDPLMFQTPFSSARRGGIL